MPNNYFRFKQFTVYQDKCAMKVCTDACLFGAWVAARSSQLKAHSFLDIGTGTGLLSLMLAQKNADTIIDAVEIDEAAAQQAKGNFDASPWKERLKVYHSSIQQFAEVNKKYDVIISNPPFYENDLKSDNTKRNLALHSSELKLEELIVIADKLLKDDGSFFVLLPYGRINEFERLIEGSFFVREKVLVRQSEKHGWFRCIYLLQRIFINVSKSDFIIMDEGDRYSNEVTNFLKNYYLYL